VAPTFLCVLQFSSEVMPFTNHIPNLEVTLTPTKAIFFCLFPAPKHLNFSPGHSFTTSGNSTPVACTEQNLKCPGDFVKSRQVLVAQTSPTRNVLVPTFLKVCASGSTMEAGPPFFASLKTSIVEGRFKRSWWLPHCLPLYNLQERYTGGLPPPFLPPPSLSPKKAVNLLRPFTLIDEAMAVVL